MLKSAKHPLNSDRAGKLKENQKEQIQTKPTHNQKTKPLKLKPKDMMRKPREKKKDAILWVLS